MDPDNVVFVQQYRTPTSEVWLAESGRDEGAAAVAQVDIHYGPTTAVVTVVFLVPPKSEQQVYRLLDLIDDELISITDMEKGGLTFRVIHGGANKSAVLKRDLSADGSDLPGAFTNG